MPGWVWNEGLRRYQDTDTGQILSFAAVQDLVDDLVDTTDETAVGTLTDMLADGRLNVADWKTNFGQAVKDIYIQQAELGAGGRENMTPREWGAVGAQLRGQYRYLDAFADQVAAGELTPGQIRYRSQMYINSSRQAFWRVRDFKEQDKGMTEERWITIGDENVCSACTDAGHMGWQPIGTFAAPGSGQVLRDPETHCVGLTNCRCRKEYR